MGAVAASSAHRARGRFRLLPAVAVEGATRRFGETVALDGVSLEVKPGEIHALLGPNGAGKTTLVRLLTGLTAPSGGSVSVLGEDVAGGRTTVTERVGFVPSGDRSFYLRLSGEENLLFFARLHGMRKPAARERARALLAEVDLADAARRPVSSYSHGMQKRLSVARALLASPPVLLVDEATHDLDPANAARVRDLVARLAHDGAAVLWATQRIEEIRGFADRVTLLVAGRVRYAGPVAGLLAHAEARRFVLRVDGEPPIAQLQAAAGAGAAVHALAEPGHVLVDLRGDSDLGSVIAAISATGAPVRDCRREQSEAEAAFLAVAGTVGA